MADKSFGLRQLNLVGVGTPSIESSTDLVVNTNGSERLRINSNGVIGIGETDLSSLGGEYRGMDVGYKGSGISGRTGNPTFTIRSNIYYDGSNWKYGEGNTSAGVLSVGGNQLIFEAAASGTSGATATLTERFRIGTIGGLKVRANGAAGVSGNTTGSHELTTDMNGFEALYVTNRNSTSPVGIQIYYPTDINNTANYFLTCYGTSNLRAGFRSNGGLANYQSNNVNLSDINTKKDISIASGTWDCIKEWEIVNYRYKDQPDDADLNLGVIAQQVAEKCPEVVTVFSEAKEAKAVVLDDDGNEIEAAREAQPEKLGVKEQQMMWMAIKALQEAQTRIETLETEKAEILARLDAAGI